MKMRKIIMTALALTLTFSLGTTVSASEIIPPGDNTGVSTDIKATYQAGSETTTPMYQVDVSWGNMDFVYHGNKAFIWNPDTLNYEGKTAGANPGWELSTAGAHSITVENHSNVPVQAAFSYEPETGYEAITGKFDQKSFFLASAEGTDVNAAPSAKATLTLEGELSDSVTSSTKIGAAKVTIDAAGEEIPVYKSRSDLTSKPENTIMKLHQKDTDTYVGTSKPFALSSGQTFFELIFKLGDYYYSLEQNNQYSLGEASGLRKTSVTDTSVGMGKIFMTGGNFDPNTDYTLTFDIKNKTLTITEA